MKRLLILGIMMILLTSCNNYTLKDAENNGDIIVGRLESPNFEKLDAFINDTKTGNPSKLRITSFTVEGDLILNDLKYDGDKINYVFDNSRDKYGGKQKGKSKTECKSIETRKVTRAENDKGYDYVLTGCNEIIGMHDAEKPEIYLLFKKE